jgi:hypothetical protein
VEFSLALMAVTSLVNEETETGDVERVFVLSPSCPETLYPQHFTTPADIRAHACCLPATTCVTPEDKELKAVGISF